jgi:hypothetical protein
MISRYLHRLAARVRPRPAEAPAFSAGPDELRIGGERVAWSEVRRLDAYKRDGYVGDHLCLAISCASGRVVEAHEGMPGWQEAGWAIERFLPGSRPHGEWMVRLLAAGPGERVEVYPAP